MVTGRIVACLAMAGLLGLAGCAATSSGDSCKSRLFFGALLETKTPDGQMQRVYVTDLASWRHWHRNPIKGDGDNLIVKAEVTF
ncbi:MAG: hypothetical protein JRI59_06200 [Deltaproteobacteria bacterium]|nr:hypothetical protein [Deltaproteobacteria bacterium]